MAPLAGMTMVLGTGATTVRGVVAQRGGQPAANARVFLRAVTGGLGETISTDGEGRFSFEAINPDVYSVRAEVGGWHSAERTLVALQPQNEPVDLVLDREGDAHGKRVKVILDKIRILDDHDPCLKGKGELVFTAAVVPDGDATRRQQTRLPTQGVYKVSDRPGVNEVAPRAVLFDGLVRHENLSICIAGKELDLFSADDPLNRYHRTFQGDPKNWYGVYRPRDEYLDSEDVGDWAVWYRIEHE